MTLAKKGEGATASVTWRMPRRVAESMNGSWDPMRAMLETWVESNTELDPADPDETTSVCLRISHEAKAALVAEAARLTKLTGKKWTEGRVAKVLWDLHEEEAEQAA